MAPSMPSERQILLTISPDLRFTEETFTIIQYAIYSLLGRSTISSPGVPMRFRELVNDVLKQHDVYSSLCVKLQLSPMNFERNFHLMAESMFDDGQMNWGRLIALVGFSVKAAEYFRSCGETQDDVVVEITSNFILRKAETWIVNRGGWVSSYLQIRLEFQSIHKKPREGKVINHWCQPKFVNSSCSEIDRYFCERQSIFKQRG